ncbi:hypothetical protein R6Q59_010107 [Mikania micrantha]
MMGGRQVMPAEPVEQARQRFDGFFEMLKPMLPQPTDAVIATDVTCPKNGRRVRIYKPTSSAESGPLPIGMYIHSGGWYGGSIENEDYLAHNICENSNMILYSPDYRLAPEHPYPAGHSDVYAAYEWMCESAVENGGDPSKKFVMGGSAGGNLTASVILKYAKDSQHKAQGAVILCPGAAHTQIMNTVYKSRYNEAFYADSPVIGNDILKQAWEWLASPPDDPLASVVLHPDIKYLPSLYIAATTKDPTYPETMFFAEKCREAKVDLVLVEWVGLPHCFHVIPTLKAAEFMRTWNDNLKGMIAKVQ